MKLATIYFGSSEKPSMNQPWYVEYYINGKRKRKYGNINREKTVHRRMEKAKMIKEVIDKLIVSQGGDNMVASGNPIALPYKKELDWALEQKKQIWQPGSIKEYTVPLNYFYKRMEDLGFTNMALGDIDTLIIRKVLEPKKSPYTYLKYKANLGNLFKFLKGWKKIKDNPCDYESLFRKPERKKRILPTSNELKKISQHLENNYPDFLTYLMVINMAAIRPKEILNLRVGDIDLGSGLIHVRGEIAKNNRSNTIVIPKTLQVRLKRLKLHLYPKDFFAFGYDFIPEERISAVPRDRATKFYKTHIKDELNVKSDMYALKHLGLRSMRSQGIEAEAVQMQARHSKYDETLGYTGLDRPELRDQLREFEGDL